MRAGLSTCPQQEERSPSFVWLAGGETWSSWLRLWKRTPMVPSGPMVVIT